MLSKRSPPHPRQSSSADRCGRSDRALTGTAGEGRGRALVCDLPIDRILAETDGPFTQVDGRPSEPADVKTTVAAIADVRRVRSMPSRRR
ncbi:TatD family hydrolase [Mesorhizobium sp. M1396]|uniref:TatD family hydrolase n=1 Tax=Mesorhizobium sp. M1396 TaxID=2957095 RepID=UPI003337B47A